MEWLGHARIKFSHAKSTLKLNAQDGTSTDLLRICEESTPPCRLNPLLFNGHLQTMWTAVKNDGPPVFYKRKVFDAEDPAYEGTFAVDFAVDPFLESDKSLPPRTAYFSEDDFKAMGSLDSRPMLVTLHGLSGGSYEVYLRHVLAPLIGKDGGWEACVVNSRGCAQHKITSSVLFNARATWDIRQTVKWLRKTFPNRPLFGVGFSLGANILTNVSFPSGFFILIDSTSSPWCAVVANEEGYLSHLGYLTVIRECWKQYNYVGSWSFKDENTQPLGKWQKQMTGVLTNILVCWGRGNVLHSKGSSSHLESMESRRRLYVPTKNMASPRILKGNGHKYEETNRDPCRRSDQESKTRS
jgi:alpha/beta hydrolase fold